MTDPSLATELERAVLRLHALGPDRLARSGPDGCAPADRVRALLTWLADAAADAEGRDRRPVPVLAPHALADQLRVLVADLQRSLAADTADTTDTTDTTDMTDTSDTSPTIDDLVHRLVELRRSL